MITVHLPHDLAEKFRAPPELALPASTLGDLLDALDRQYPGMRHWVAEVDGRFRRHLSVFVAGARLSGDEGAEFRLAPDQEVWVLRAVSGG